MKNKIFPILIVLSMMAIAKSSAHALEIEVDNHGVTRFWQDQVLGRNAGAGITQMKNVAAKAQAAAETKVGEPIRTIRPYEKQVIQIEPAENSGSIVRIRDQYDDEEIESMRQAAQELKEKASDLKEKAGNLKEETKDLREEAENIKQQAFEKKEEMKATRVELKAQIKSQIQDKKEEKEVQIRTKLAEILGDDAATELEIESNGIKAATKSMVTVDPDTKQLQLVTPDGEVHILTYLPDEALDAMRRNGKLTGENAGNIKPNATEIEVGEDGSVQYKTTVVQEKKLFGLFKRNIENQIVLNDQTGEVTEAIQENLSPLASLLNKLSI